MPIRPENRSRYPPEWPAISKRIREERAERQCECRGECGTDHAAEGVRVVGFYRDIGRCSARNREPHPVTGSLVVLTVAHLDHTPEHCDDENLRAFCQRCHLAYDAPRHAVNRKINRHRLVEDMFGGPSEDEIEAAKQRQPA